MLKRHQNTRQNPLFLPKSGKPLYPLLLPKPRELPFCVMSDIKFCLLNGARKVSLPLQVLDDPAVPMGSEGIETGRNALGNQPLDLIDQSSFEVCFGALIDTVVKRIPRWIQCDYP